MQDHSIAGIDILIRGPRSPVTDAVLEMFRLTHPVRLPEKVRLFIHDLQGSEDLDRTLPLWVCGKLNQLPPSEEVLMVYGSRGELAAIINNGAARYCAWMAGTADEIRYVSCKMTAKRTPLSVSSVLVPVLRELVARRGKLLVHAASLRYPDGTGILLLADSGGGKTTTALSILRQGAWFLSDDLTVLQETDEQVYMTGFPELLNLTDQTVNFFPELRDFLSGSDRQIATGKRMISAQKVYGSVRMLESCHLHAVYFVNIVPQGPLAKPVNTSNAIGKFIRAHTFARSQSMPASSVESLFSILSHIPVFDLHSGPDPVSLGKWLIENNGTHRSISTG